MPGWVGPTARVSVTGRSANNFIFKILTRTKACCVSACSSLIMPNDFLLTAIHT